MILGGLGDHFGIQNRLKVASNIDNLFCWFFISFGTFFNDFQRVVETLDLQKWASRPGEVLFFINSHFFKQNRFWTDLWMILGGFGDHFGSQHRWKMASKMDQTIDWFLDRSWKGSGPPREARPRLSREGRGPRRGVGDLSPRGHWGCGKWGKRASKPLDAPTGLVGFRCCSIYL